MDMNHVYPEYRAGDIAVIGMAGRFPEADNLDEFWANIAGGHESIRELPDQRKEEMAAMLGNLPAIDFIRAGYLEQVTLFEPELFAISYEECKYIDPQHKLLLELTEEAIIDAGYNPMELNQQRVGVFIADNRVNYISRIAPASPMAITNSATSVSAGRIAYTYNLHGPTLTVGTACSSSLTALHYACQSLRSGEVELVITGGCEMVLLPEDQSEVGGGTIFSAVQKVRAFDRGANGTARGEGGGVLLLKRMSQALQDGDNIHAVIKGSGVTSDGRLSNGMSAPSEQGQADVLLTALADAGIDPKTISYLEAHGTGTRIGDPIEIAALSQVFTHFGLRPQSIPIGSVKTNIGHLIGAAGMAGLLKTILALKKRQIPPSLNFAEPNPLIDFINSPIYLNERLRDWTRDGSAPRRAGVTSLGLIGTNCHLIVEEAPKVVEVVDRDEKSKSHLVLISARTESSLYRMIRNLADDLEKNDQLTIQDIAFTLNSGRRSLKYNFATVAQSRAELVGSLRKIGEMYADELQFKKELAIHDQVNITTEKQRLCCIFQKKRKEICLLFIFPNYKSVDLSLFADFASRVVGYQAQVDSLVEELSVDGVDDLKNPKVQYLVYLYAYVKLLASYSIEPQAVLGIGAGEILADLVCEEISLIEAIQFINDFTPTDEAGLEVTDQTQNVIHEIVQSEINLWLPIHFDCDLQQTLKHLTHDQADVKMIPFTVEAVGFYSGILNLYAQGLQIKWREVYRHQQVKRVSLPGYIFDRQHFYLQVEREIAAFNRPTTIDASPSLLRGLLHQLVWEKDQRDVEAESLTIGTWLIFHDQMGVGHTLKEMLKEQGHNLIEVKAGDEFLSLSPTEYQINIYSSEDYQRLISMIHQSQPKISGLIHLFHCESTQSQYDLLRQANGSDQMSRGVLSVLYLNQALFKYYRDVSSYYVTTNAHRILAEDSLVNPANRMVWALNKIINQEQDHSTLISLDFDQKSSVKEMAEQIYQEIVSDQVDLDLLEIGYRQGNRYTQILRTSPEDRTSAVDLPLKTGGVYLVTGGTGGIALELCKFIAGQEKVHLILLSRRHLANTRIRDYSYKEQALVELKGQCLSLELAFGDVTDYQQMKEVIGKIKEDYGKIDGVIHSAGIAGAREIFSEFTVEDFCQTIDAKVKGTMILEELLRDQFLDFFLLSSSISANLGGFGYTAYAPANAFLDGFSTMQRQLGKKYISIDWGAWKEVGLGREKEQRQYASGLIQLTNQEGVSAFATILAHNLDNYWVTVLDDRIKELYGSFRFFKLAETDLGKTEEPLNSVTVSRETPKAIEESLLRMLGEVYTGEELNIESKIYQIDLDSIEIMQFAGKVKKTFNVEIPFKLFFDDVTITQLIGDLTEQILKVTYGEHTIPQIAEARFYPVSSAQKRIFILQELDSQSTTYNLPGALFIEGKLDQEAFMQAFQGLVERHQAFRTSFVFEKGELVQQIDQEVNFAVEVEQVALTMTELTGREELAEFVRPFVLSRPPLLRVKLFQLGERDQYLLLFDMHHIISDGISREIMVQEFLELYAGRELPKLRIQYKDFAVWQQGELARGLYEEQERYWLKNFEDEIPVLNLPTDHPRPHVNSSAGETIGFALTEELSAQLKSLAGEEGVTVYMFLLAVYTLLLAKYSGQREIVVGSPIAGRHHDDLSRIIGIFVNTLAMKNQVYREETFQEFLARVRVNALAAYENQDYPFESLVEKLNLQRDLSRNPLFDTMFTLQNIHNTSLSSSELRVTPVVLDHQVSKFDLSLMAMEEGDRFRFKLEYSTTLFERSSMERLKGHLIQIIKEVVDRPEVSLGQIQMITDAERRQIVEKFNNMSRAYPESETLISLFTKQVAQQSDRLAVILEDREITYRELAVRANRLAAQLRQRGIEAEEPVAIMTTRSLEMLVGIYGILLAQGAYLPIDPNYPDERIDYMLRDSSTRFLLTTESVERSASVEFVGETILLDEGDSFDSMGLDDEKLLEELRLAAAGSQPDQLAYIIYTSGSTGRPKGTLIEHRSVINRLSWMQRKYPLNERDRIMQKTPFTFDVSVWELFWWAITGAQVYLLAPGGEKEPEQIIRGIERQQITIIHFVPSMLNAFLEYLESVQTPVKIESLRHLFASGESLQVSQVVKFNQYLHQPFSTTLHNLYGPTEATVDVTYFDCLPDVVEETIPIGKPIDNTQIYILDENDHLQPIGVPGELCIGGVGVGRGYLNRQELTEEKFVLDPIKGNGRLYRTGDLAKWRSDGNIEYLGRLDHQVKIRGFRIELGEIESKLLAHPGVKEGVVVAGQDSNGDKYLAAYLTVEPGEMSWQSDGDGQVVREIKEELARSLPDYMVPAYFVFLPQLPLSANGKLDRKALPKPVTQTGSDREYCAPTTEVEEKLVQIWQEILLRERVGITDNFFDLGGDSIKGLRVISRFGGGFLLADLFKYPTIKSLTSFLENDQTESGLLHELTPPRKEKKFSLVCVAYGGGNAIAYQPLADALRLTGLADQIALYAVAIPGHDPGQPETELQSIREVAERCVVEIKERCQTPVILYGHCVGTALTMEIARLLSVEKQAGCSTQLLAVGLGGHMLKGKGLFRRPALDPWKNSSDQRIYDFLQKLGGFKGELEPGELKLIMKSFRHDVRSMAEYFYGSDDDPVKLDVPIWCIVGDRDSLTRGSWYKYRRWLRYADDVELVTIRGGGHYFLEEQPEELAKVLVQLVG